MWIIPQVYYENVAFIKLLLDKNSRVSTGAICKIKKKDKSQSDCGLFSIVPTRVGRNIFTIETTEINSRQNMEYFIKYQVALWALFIESNSGAANSATTHYLNFSESACCPRTILHFNFETAYTEDKCESYIS